MPRSPVQNPDWDNFDDALRRARSLATAGRYAATVVHDINNPLEAATNLAYLLKEDADDPIKVREYAVLLEEQLAVVAGITRQTLEYYRSPDGMKALNLVDVANAAIRVHEHKIAAKELRLRKVLPEQVLVTANAGELLQVVTNLLANAVDALPAKGTISIKIRRCENEAHLLVVDNGHGIPEPILAKVFEPFFSTKGDRGTGLGLAISKSILERHSGRIRARSCVRPGRNGTAFRISLPLQRVESDHNTEA